MTSIQTTHNDIPANVVEYTTVGNTLMKLNRELPQRLVGVWAHPDDEAYLSAGLMARVVANGGHVTLITATPGQKGTSDPSLYDSEQFAAHRERELIASLAELGVTDVRMLGYSDGECDLVDDESAVRAIADVITEIDPDVVLTFGPDGITGHTDHRLVSSWTTEAWRRHTQSGGAADLLYAAMTHDFIVKNRNLHDSIGVFGELGTTGPASVSRSSIALECTLSESELDSKRRALAAHASQTDQLAEMMGETIYRTWWGAERFRRPTRSECDSCQLSPRTRKASAGTEPRQLIGAAA